MTRILVLEDDPSQARLLATNLTFEGYEVVICSDGLAALKCQAETPCDLLILDLMLPQMDGFQVLQQLRDRGDDSPVIILTCKKRELDRVKGLRLGADDYLVKPYSLLELMARLRAILRRVRPVAPFPISRSGPFSLDHLRLRAFRDNQDLQLTPREFLLLSVFLRHPGVTLGRNDLLNAAWDPDARPTIRTVDVHLARLRKKLGPEADTAVMTLGGEGYRWSLPVINQQGSRGL